MYNSSTKFNLCQVCPTHIHTYMYQQNDKNKDTSKDAVELFTKNNIHIGDIASELFNCNLGHIGRITYLLNPKEPLHILTTVYKKGSFRNTVKSV